MGIRIPAPLVFTLFLVIAFVGRRVLPSSVGELWPIAAALVALGLVVALDAVVRARR